MTGNAPNHLWHLLISTLGDTCLMEEYEALNIVADILQMQIVKNSNHDKNFRFATVVTL